LAAPVSAGILLFRNEGQAVEVLLIRPGGPFWKNRSTGAWMIPKGLVEAGETSAEAALREFAEETGTRLSAMPFPLCRIRQAAGKVVEAFAVEGTLDAAAVTSNMFELEYPRGSGRMQLFREVEEARWFTFDDARREILPSQRPILDALEERLR